MPARVHASFVHLILSLVIILPVYALVFLVWYPSPWFGLTGAWKLIAVLTGVHLCIGPLITLLVYKPGKKGMLFDLWVIGIMQVAALVWGGWALHQHRPAYLVFAVDRFNVLTPRDVDAGEAGSAEVGERSVVGPVLVYAEMPNDEAGRQKLLREVFFEGKPDLESRPEFWRPYPQGRNAVLARAQPMNALHADKPWQRPAVEAAVARAGVPAARLAWLPAMGPRKDFAVIVDTETADILAFVEVDPWVR